MGRVDKLISKEKKAGQWERGGRCCRRRWFLRLQKKWVFNPGDIWCRRGRGRRRRATPFSFLSIPAFYMSMDNFLGLVSLSPWQQSYGTFSLCCDSEGRCETDEQACEQERGSESDTEIRLHAPTAANADATVYAAAACCSGMLVEAKNFQQHHIKWEREEDVRAGSGCTRTLNQVASDFLTEVFILEIGGLLIFKPESRSPSMEDCRRSNGIIDFSQTLVNRD